MSKASKTTKLTPLPTEKGKRGKKDKGFMATLWENIIPYVVVLASVIALDYIALYYFRTKYTGSYDIGVLVGSVAIIVLAVEVHSVWRVFSKKK